MFSSRIHTFDVNLYILQLLMALNDDSHKILIKSCIVFVCEFIELDSGLIGPRRYPEQ